MSYKIPRQVLGLFSAGLLFATMAACGGGGSSGGTVAPSISGKASAPGGTVAHFENQSVLKVAGNFLFPTAQAAITGLQPVPGATVELYQINNDGNPTGEALASTVTSITGDYQLILPAGFNFAANYILRITSADGTQTLDAQAVEAAVNIDPYSDYLLDKLVENGTQLDTLATNEVIKLKGKLEEFDLTAGSNMSEMLAALEEATGEFMDDNIEAVNNGDGDASTVAGAYHFGEFAFSLHDSDDDPYGTFSTEIILESLKLVAEEGNNLKAEFDNARLDTWYNLQYRPEGSHQLYVESSFENIPETETATVDGSGALIFNSEFEEEVEDCESDNPTQDCFGWRSPATTARIEPLGSTGIFLGRFIDASVRYHLTEDKVLDPANKAGDEVFYTLAMVAKKGTDLSTASLSGKYGIVGIEASAAHLTGETAIEGYYSVENFDGAGNVTEEMFNGFTINRNPNTAPTSETDTVPENFQYSVTSDGTLVLTDGQENDAGFITEDGNVIAAFLHETDDDGQNPPTISAASNGMLIGLKLPTTTPTMAGKTYQLQNLMFGYDGSETELSSFSGGLLKFNSGGAVSLSAVRIRSLERPNDGSDLESSVEKTGSIADNNAAMILTNGKFSSTLALDDGTNVIIEGFISESQDMVIFRSVYDLEGDKSVGLFIGSLISE